MITVRRLKNQKAVKLLSSLQFLVVGGRFDATGDVPYMGKETVREYFDSFCKDLVDMYGYIYLRRWSTDLDKRSSARS